MPRRVIVILACLVAIIAALSVYSFNLNRGIITLAELQQETNREIGSMQASIYLLDSKIASLKEGLANQTTGIQNQIASLNIKIEDIPSAIDTTGLYQKAKKSLVKVVAENQGRQKAIGSGFVFENEYIVTAYHVIKDADRVDIILDDGTISTAAIAGYCPYSDIAVLKIEQAKTTDMLTIGDSDTIVIGEPVIVMGSPFELSGTLTSGIISQKDRFIEIEYNGNERRWVANIIQCDASINFGNSGGPLINAHGEVIGLVVARINPQEGDGIYYAVSSNKLKRVANAIINLGAFDYPWLGISIANLSPDEARSAQLSTVNGVRVADILNGPVSLTGIITNDIIIAIDEIPVNNVADLTGYLGEYKNPQEIVTISIIRGEEKINFPVQLEKRTS